MARRFTPGENCTISIMVDTESEEPVYADNAQLMNVYAKRLKFRIAIPGEDCVDILLTREQAKAIAKAMKKHSKDI